MKIKIRALLLLLVTHSMVFSNPKDFKKSKNIFYETNIGYTLQGIVALAVMEGIV